MRPVLFFLVFLSIITAKAQENDNLKRKLDIFWNSKKLRARLVSEAISFHPGDVVADIGTADGWFTAALSVYADSLTFYLEDVDSSVWNAANFARAITSFFGKAQKTLTHTFEYRLGSEKDTGLPRNTFNYVLIIDTYHHFAHRREMLANIVSLLKPGGKIVVLEAIARRSGDFHPGCRSKIFTQEDIMSDFAEHGMTLEKSQFAGKASRRSNHIFVFAGVQ